MTTMENTDNPQDNPDRPPVPEPSGEADKTGTLSVRQPMRLLKRLDEACKERGTTRTELVRAILESYFNPAQPSEELATDVESLTSRNQLLETALQDLNNRYQALLQQPKDSDYTAELENDLIKAVEIGCRSIMATRSDYRKKLKHYSRLELGN
ncbi:ribbon-helix-helix domain-containing protein [Spirosoma aerolatum]|uniref:ribbon-helix-helix domain-containing protein n=1 Tax=Spirosoma aerolatum TaxID=1211326 RepID=UPI0012D2D7BE|nr:ribbon-helix-helix domain-containing protein [Spirosoma aerolatum]